MNARRLVSSYEYSLIQAERKKYLATPEGVQEQEDIKRREKEAARAERQKRGEEYRKANGYE